MKRIYPVELLNAVKQFNYIPRKLSKNEHLKLYHRYWIPDMGGIIKVKDIWREEKTEYYIVKYKGDLSICFPYPLNEYSGAYELLHDYDNIFKKEIINDNNFYTGAEIKYWFVVNSSKSHEKFGKYLTMNSKLSIQDNKKYKVIINSQNKYCIEMEK
jgi:hypothetical protein